MGMLLIGVSALVLRDDPIRNEGSGHEQAVQQVKSFAQFIQNRPELAHPVARSVVTMARERFQESQDASSSDHFEIEKEVMPLVQQMDDPKMKALLAQKIKEHGPAIVRALDQSLHSPALKRNEAWDEKIELLLEMGALKDLNSDVKNEAMDLVGDQLLQARVDPSDVVRYLTDDRFERYLQSEQRPDRKQQMITIFNERVLQSINQPAEPSAPKDSSGRR